MNNNNLLPEIMNCIAKIEKGDKELCRPQNLLEPAEFEEDITVSFVDLVAALCAVGLTGLGVYCIWQSSDWAIDRKLLRYRRTKIHEDLDQLGPDHPRYWSRLLDLNDVEK